MADNMDLQHSRTKRAVDEEALWEMALLTKGSYEATVSAVSDTSITLSFPELPAGKYTVVVNRKGGVGNAVSTLAQLRSNMAISGVNPASGSIHGGQVITVAGGGFSGDRSTGVTIGDTTCTVMSATPSSITCLTEACSESCGDLVVSTGASTQASSSAYSYLAASSPVVSSASASGSTLTISGTDLGTDTSTVSFGDVACPVTAAAGGTSITGTLPNLAGGNYPVVVTNPSLGNSNNEVVHNVQLLLSTVAPGTGSFGEEAQVSP